MLDAVLKNLIDIGWAMLIFLAANLANGLFPVLQHSDFASAL